MLDRKRIQGVIAGSVPTLTFGGSATATAGLTIEVTLAGISGAAKVKVTADDGTAVLAESVVTSGSALTLASGYGTLSMTWTGTLAKGDTWYCRMNAGVVTDLQPGGGNRSGQWVDIAVDEDGRITGPLTDTELRATAVPVSSTPAVSVTKLKQDRVTLSTAVSETAIDSAVALSIMNRSTAVISLSTFGNEDGVAQVDTNTIASGVTLGGDLDVTVTKAGMTGSPKTITAAALGTRQVETITCTGAPSATGNITLEVTAAGMNGGVGVDVVVALDHTTDTTPALVGDKVRAAMEADSDVSGFFTVGGTAGALVLTAKTADDDDATMAVAFTDTDTTGATFGASADTTAGVAPSTDEEVAEIVKDALNADGVIGAAFTATRSGADVILTAASAAANDATISLVVETGTATGLTSSTSVNTTEGYAAGDWDELGAWGTLEYTPPPGTRNTSPFTKLWMKADAGTPTVVVNGWKEA